MLLPKTCLDIVELEASSEGTPSLQVEKLGPIKG